ncbi:SMAD/FHA domain-containing protein [Absidia repens]|uniref:SMAD/FHA domain-containing protein n=1 Tax=Absidia repens TaxID=90262 RepID=A0A1X2IY84_9FUNG|nr:SMAD/FHA domain-containing protein [Absidia repens]
MTESLSQTQLIEDTNRFGKCKGATSFVNSNSGDGEIYNYNSNIDNNNNGANHHRSFSPTTSPSSVIYTVVLQPFDSHFPVKTIEIKENTKCRIGRQSNAKTVPKPLNGYFDSKVLSRNHAILWSEPEGGGVWIKDTKSSNGTFLNGHRLSEELEESEPFELKTGDQIAFGIDIIGEDGSILYHKVACSISIFNIPVDQMDLSTLKGFNLMNGLTSEGDTSQQRRSSVSSVASGKDTITNHSSKPMANQNKQWELLLAKLEITGC